MSNPPQKQSFIKRMSLCCIVLQLSTFTFGFSLEAEASSRKSRAMSHFPEQVPSAQDHWVSGSVKSAGGEPLPGATVVEKGTTNGSVTDLDGNFRINVSESANLVISFIGYTTREISVRSRTAVDVTLEPTTTSLEEVVVIGYGTAKKSDLTGSVASAPLEAFLEAPNTSILQSLSGTVAGVTVNQSQFAGGEPDIQIRGRSTLNGAQDPLIVLDGIIYRGRIGDLNPGDIESIDILKDPSSKAIYGAQSANGVVIITTKQGKVSERPVITYSGYYATQTPANELTTYDREGYLKKARNVVWFADNPGAGVVGPYLAPDYTQPNPAWNDGDHIAFTAPQMAGYNAGTDFNWYDEVTSPGHIADHQLSIRAASEKTSYFISGGYTDQVGWMLNDTYKRYTVRINIDTDVTDWLTIGANTFGSFSDMSGQSPRLELLPMMSPLAAPRDGNGEFIPVPMGNNITNPFLASSADDLDKINNFSGIFFANVRIPQIEGLSYRINFSNNLVSTRRYFSDIYGSGITGSASKRNGATFDMMLDNIVTFQRRFAEHHGINATLVYGWNKRSGESTTASGTNYSNLDLSYNNLSQAVNQLISSTAWKEQFLYQMARLSYDFKNKYFLTGTVRRDGFSGFAENKKIGIFPSLGVGWMLSEEQVLKNSTFVNLLKIRASYGVTGNLTGRYSSQAQVSGNSRYIFGDGGSTVNGQTVTSLQNSNLTWEKTTGTNLGIDFAFFGEKLSGSLDFYQSTTTDLLWDLSLPALTGFDEIRTNLGKIANSGVELQLNATAVSSGPFAWNIGANISHNRNKIEELIGLDNDGDGKEDDLVSEGLFIGESIGRIYNYEVDRIWQIGDDIPTGYFPGSYKLVDVNGDGVITPDDRKILGRTEPAYSFGIQNTLSYKDFTLRFFVKGVQGGANGYMLANNPNEHNSTSLAQNTNWFREIDFWSPDNPDALYNLPGRDAQIDGVRYFQRNFVRLQDISLAYNVNRTITEKIGLQGVKLYVSGKNLLTITDWQGWDPETGQGFSRGTSSLPLMKGYTVGLDITL